MMRSPIKKKKKVFEMQSFLCCPQLPYITFGFRSMVNPLILTVNIKSKQSKYTMKNPLSKWAL